MSEYDREDATTPEPRDTEGDGAPKKKRRRRRRSKKKTGDGGAAEQAAESSEQSATQADSEPASGEKPSGGGKKKSRKRGGKGRGRKSDRPARDTDDPDAGVEPKRRKRRDSVDEETRKNSDVFADSTFADLGLRDSVLKGVTEAGFVQPTWIQQELIPHALQGRDVLGQAKTGSGKTAAFALPLYHLAEAGKPFQGIVLAPTRELAIQIADEMTELGRFTPLKVLAVYGGQNISTQAERLKKGPELIVATPGRLLDMVDRGYLTLRDVKFAVLDEVDRMLDIGFRDDIRKILGQIKSEHQTVFVSATLSDEIEKLARKYMKDPVRVEPASQSLTVELVEQHYLPVAPWDKMRLLTHLLTHEDPDTTIVFCRTKRTVDKVTRYLNDKKIDARAIHGDMPQGKRNRVINQLREGELGVLVASDLAARGLDVEHISHVVNYDLPEDPEIYVHRIGRTARAGRRGVAWTFVAPDQGDLLTQIEVLTNKEIPKMDYPDFKPGDVPPEVRRRQEEEAQRQAAGPGPNRLQRSAPVVPRQETAVDPSRFPGGVVPKKLPPRMMHGKVKTHRSGKDAPGEAVETPSNA